MINEKNNINFAFFGTDNFAVKVLEKLKLESYLPKVIITTEDKPKGRKLILTETESKTWAKENNIEFIEVKKLDSDFVSKFKKYNLDVSIVASFGKIIPKEVLEIPKYKTLNVHPSLLPKLRGPSPIESAILQENETGVTIIRLDEEVDHGPVLAQEKIQVEWPPNKTDLENKLAELGGKILSLILVKWVKGEIEEKEQDHSKATFTKKIDKKDAEINLEDGAEINLRKIRAFDSSPNAYFFKEINGEQKRILVKSARIDNDELIIEKVVPEGKKEMSYQDFLRGIK